MRRGKLTFVALVVLLAALSVVELSGHAVGVDVLLYASAAARANAEGALPYTAAWIEKGPLAMGLYQLLFAAFGNYNLLAVLAAWLALAVVGMALAWQLAVQIGARRSGPWAGALYVIAIIPLCGTLNTELPASVAAAAAVAVWLCSARAERTRLPLAFAAGALVGVAFLCRQNTGVLWPVLLGAEALRAWGGDRARFRDVALGSTALTAGFLAVTGATVVTYAIAGGLGTFWFCFYEYNREIYIAATRVTWPRVLAAPWTAAKQFLLPVPTTGLIGLLGAVTAAATAYRAPREDPHRLARVVVLISAVGLTASLFTGLRFFTHYFALVLPVWAALGALAIDRISGDGNRRRARITTAVLLLMFGAELGRYPWLQSAYRIKRRVAEHGLRDLSDPLHWPGRDALAADVARFIREHGDDSDRVFVWGMRPHVYVYARRIPATRFVTCTFLTGLVPWERSAPSEDTARWIVPGSWDALMEDLEGDSPRFIVDASDDHLFGQGAYAVERFPDLHAFLVHDYEKVFETGSTDRMVVWERRP